VKPRVEVSNPDKVLFPDDRITKADLAAYYAAVAEVMVPHTRGHPVMMQRFPNGIARPGFVQKAVKSAPSWVRVVEVPKKGGTVTHVVIGDAATLVWLADQACITPHLLLSRADRLDKPDRLIFDLDPWGDEPAGVRAAALWMRDLLTDLGLAPLAMSTGSRGVHLVVALDRAAGFDETRRFAWDVADLLARRHPDALTVETRRAARGGRLYLDILRNGYAQSTVAPYAVRPIKGAPVAVPVRWEEVEDSRLDPRRHTLRTTPERIRGDGDPWAGMSRRGRSLREPRRRLDAMRSAEGRVSASPGA